MKSAARRDRNAQANIQTGWPKRSEADDFARRPRLSRLSTAGATDFSDLEQQYKL
jgi:hypothetical protein